MCDSFQSKPMLGNWGDQNSFRTAWHQMVTGYSEKKMTKLSDRPVAFSGIAGYTQSHIKDEYLAGLWRQDLAKQLLWHTNGQHALQPRAASAGAFLAPSWSWLSVNTPIGYHHRYAWEELSTHPTMLMYGEGDLWFRYIDRLKDIDATIRSEHHSRLHSFSSGELSLEGIGLWGYDTGFVPNVDLGSRSMKGEVIQYRFSASGSGRNVENIEDHRDLLRPHFITKDTEEMDVVWDTSAKPMSGMGGDDLFFLVVYISWSVKKNSLEKVEGLVLKEMEGENRGIFTREAIFSTVSAFSFPSGPLSGLATYLWKKSSNEDRELGRLTFDNPEIAELLQTITIV
ncbi:hypothetical protein V8F20_011612 [Naviculisporaceae sp. PSN 640]